MAWKEAAAQLGTSTLISGLKALKATMKKRDFKRLVSTTAAQVLAVHPDVKPRKARRWAQKATGTRAVKAGIGKKGSGGVKGAVEAAGAAALTAGAAKVASKLADRPAVKRRIAKTLHPKTDPTEASTES
ncbi:MAG TPA: hypothetical protein VM536_03930 [Chloroflexia bacterium]|nr:hypothetical protein [Chloroflexia bacterium]